MNKNIRDLTLIAVITAIICVLAPLSLPIGLVPISLTNLVLYFSIYLLGMKKTLVSYTAYLLIGFIGVPVFSGYSAGPAKLLGPTGGYLIGFFPLVLIAGWVIDTFYHKWYLEFIGMVIGTAVCYVFGTAWLAYQANMTFYTALGVGVLPFIPGDLIKIVLALILAPQIKKRLGVAYK